jgi:hypothetical protein
MIEVSSIAQGPDFWKVSDQARVMWATQSGWPAPALALRIARPTAPDDSASLQGYRVPRWLTRSHLAVHSRVPLIPIWPGFAVNTIFYGAMLWLLIRGPFILRRRLRMKREPHPLR